MLLSDGIHDFNQQSVGRLRNYCFAYSLNRSENPVTYFIDHIFVNMKEASAFRLFFSEYRFHIHEYGAVIPVVGMTQCA